VQVPCSLSLRQVPRKEIILQSDMCLVNGMENKEKK